MPASIVDKDALHYLLWMDRDAHDSIRLNQTELGEELRVDQPSMNRIIRTMVRTGRLEKLGTGRYRVTDPATWTPPPF